MKKATKKARRLRVQAVGARLRKALVSLARDLRAEPQEAQPQGGGRVSAPRLTVIPPSVARPGAPAVVHWSTGNGSIGRVTVTAGDGQERLFAVGTQGTQEADWLQTNLTYRFQLYGVRLPKPVSGIGRVLQRRPAPRETVLATAQVWQPEVNWANARHMVLARADQPEHRADIAQLVAQLAEKFIHPPLYEEYFQYWEEHGFHLTPNHFYWPIPDTRTLDESVWTRRASLTGVRMNDDEQLRLLREVFPTYQEEYNAFPLEPTGSHEDYYFDNGIFGGTDALVLYCMVRHFKPKRIVEIGSGFSSKVSAKAALLNGDTKLTCIEPYPGEDLKKGIRGIDELLVEKIQSIGFDIFESLEDGDILFIDTSHIVTIGSDVNYIFLEVVPRLRPGVIVHIHDIYLPEEYQRWRVLRDKYFWNEQYLVHAFLLFNSEFEILFANTYAADTFRAEMEAAFPHSPWYGGGSIWLRRVVR